MTEVLRREWTWTWLPLSFWRNGSHLGGRGRNPPVFWIWYQVEVWLSVKSRVFFNALVLMRRHSSGMSAWHAHAVRVRVLFLRALCTATAHQRTSCRLSSEWRLVNNFILAFCCLFYPSVVTIDSKWRWAVLLVSKRRPTHKGQKHAFHRWPAEAAKTGCKKKHNIQTFTNMFHFFFIGQLIGN